MPAGMAASAARVTCSRPPAVSKLDTGNVPGGWMQGTAVGGAQRSFISARRPPPRLLAHHAPRREGLDTPRNSRCIATAGSVTSSAPIAPGTRLPSPSAPVASGSKPATAPGEDLSSSESSSSGVDVVGYGLKFRVREVEPTEYWDVAEVHADSFYPTARQPLLFLLQLDRVLALHLGKVIEKNRQALNGKYRCLVAAASSQRSEERSFDWMLEAIASRMAARFGRSRKECNYIFGAIVVDTLAQYIPKQLMSKGSRVTKAYISNLAVSTAARRQGIGEAVLRQAESLACEWKCDEIYLHCDPMNAAAYRLYLKAGYVVVDQSITGVTKQPRQDAHLVLMTKPAALCH